MARNGGRTRGFGRVLVLASMLASASTCAVGCGGASTSTGVAGKGDGGSAGTDAGMGGSTAGTTAQGGSSGAATGGTGTGGVAASGGSGGGTSKGGTGGTSGVGGGCVLDCDDIPCPDGMLVSPGECECPVCRCNEVACPTTDCKDGSSPVLKPGACCAVCLPPDIDACETDADCVMALSTLECCGCPTSVSRAHYEEDPCLLVQGEMRDFPEHCLTPCPAIVCAQCPEQTPTCAGTCLAVTGPPNR